MSEPGGHGRGTRSGAAAPADDELARQMAAFNETRTFTTEKLLKESGVERTELVRGADGRRYVRKYIDLGGGRDGGRGDSGAGNGADGGGDTGGTGTASHGSENADGKAGGARDVRDVRAGRAGTHPYEMLNGIGCPFLPHVVFAAPIADKLVVVTDYVEGQSLRALVAGAGPLPYVRARRLARCVCMALSALHEAACPAIVHRDVNPGNIVVNGNVAVLIDLGVARVHRADAPRDTRLLGTAGYTAPEQYGFRQTDARADIYSLGMVVRFMLTGREPGEEGADGEMPAPLADVVEKATSLEPSARYGNVREMQEGLERAFDALGAVDVQAAGAGSGARTCGAPPRESADPPAWTDPEHACAQTPAPGPMPAPAPATPWAARESAFAQAPAHAKPGHVGARPPQVLPAAGATPACSAAAPPPSPRPKDHAKAKRVAWRIWQTAAAICLAFLEAALLSVSIAHPSANVIASSLIFGILFFGIPLLCCINPGDFLARLPGFRKTGHPRLFRAVAAIVASIVACVILVVVIEQTGFELGM